MQDIRFGSEHWIQTVYTHTHTHTFPRHKNDSVPGHPETGGPSHRKTLDVFPVLDTISSVIYENVLHFLHQYHLHMKPFYSDHPHSSYLIYFSVLVVSLVYRLITLMSLTLVNKSPSSILPSIKGL